jgi:hypothetical protein
MLERSIQYVQRSVRLPPTADGILELTISKLAEEKPQKHAKQVQ